MPAEVNETESTVSLVLTGEDGEVKHEQVVTRQVGDADQEESE